MKDFLIFAGVVFFLIAALVVSGTLVYLFSKGLNRTRIDENIRWILAAKPGTQRSLQNIEPDLAKEYIHQLKCYRKAFCVYYPKEKILILERSHD